MTVLSGGVKNLFGCVPGLQKPEMHLRLPDADRFSDMLIDLALLVKPDLTVLDAVLCMEGNGPTAGAARRYGWTFASRDPFAQDAFAARLIGIPEDRVPLIRLARQRGLLDVELTLAGDAPEPAMPPFRMPDSAPIDFARALPGPLRRPAGAALNALLKPRPEVLAKRLAWDAAAAPRAAPRILSASRAAARRSGGEAAYPVSAVWSMCQKKAIRIRRRLGGGRTSS